MMATVERTVDIAASPETVWSIIADPSYLPKLVPDLISNEVDPPGVAAVGQKGHAVGKIAGRRVDIFTEVTEVQPNKKLAFSQRPGGLFKSFSNTVTLTPTKTGTRATQTTKYEPSLGYLGKVLSSLVVSRSIEKNAKAFLTNTKEIAELKEMPKPSAG